MINQIFIIVIDQHITECWDLQCVPVSCWKYVHRTIKKKPLRCIDVFEAFSDFGGNNVLGNHQLRLGSCKLWKQKHRSSCLEKALMLGKVEGKTRGKRPAIKWMDSVIMIMSHHYKTLKRGNRLSERKSIYMFARSQRWFEDTINHSVNHWMERPGSFEKVLTLVKCLKDHIRTALGKIYLCNW